MLLGAALALSACGGSVPEATPSSTSAANPSRSCLASELIYDLTVPEAGRGEGYVVINIRAAGGGTCQLEGYPKVAFANQAGTSESGLPAQQQPGENARYEVRPGTVVPLVVQLRTQDAVGSPCELQHANGIIVTPPGGEVGTFLEYPTDVCSDMDQPMLKVWPLGVTFDQAYG
ncbi:hypothetical protein BSZ39_00205 [Bowdeniella nasicola]|uniref:DUF4232 domain-containing protein n=2 Tax=Bowdeniella nasicola TaxID=208480 RepID=A0A1Q5Q626_9ACTO|nr:hypothetical protein BSZ39_00205 [Bowdeniella nasicola]